MKKMFSVIIAALFALTAALPCLASGAEAENLKSDAAEPLLHWGFEHDPLTEGFAYLDSDGDGRNWGWSSDYYRVLACHDGMYSAYSESFDNWNFVGFTPDNWLITPEFTGERVTFWMAAHDPEYADDYVGVYASSDGGETWSEELGGWFTPAGGYERFTVELGEYANIPIKFAFRHYNCTDVFIALIDDVEVFGGSAMLMGDADLNGSVTVADAVLILRHAMQLSQLADEALAVSDMNGDGGVAVSDALIVLRIAMGIRHAGF